MIKEYVAHPFEREPHDGFDIDSSFNRQFSLPVERDFQSAKSNAPPLRRWVFRFEGTNPPDVYVQFGKI